MGATVITILSSVLGAFFILAGLFIALGSAALGGLVGAAGAQNPGAAGIGGMFAGLGIVFAIVIFVIAGLYIASAYGVWKARGWAWMLTVVVSIIFLVFGVLGLAGDINLFSIFFVAAPVVTLYFLFQRDVKRYLGRAAA